MTKSEMARAFMQLCKGYEDAHGRYTLPTNTTPTAKGKLEASQDLRKTWTRLPGSKVTEGLWHQHLEGAEGAYMLGIVPTNVEGISFFSVGDVDVYPVDHAQIEKVINDLRLPLIVVRTKSGGAHLYLFIKGGAPSSLVRAKMKEWMERLGYGSSEIFPKQDKVTGPGDAGNWVNMPYYAEEFSNRYAIRDGVGLNTEEFLTWAPTKAITADELAVIKMPDNVGSLGIITPGQQPAPTKIRRNRRDPQDGQNKGTFSGAPPCLQALNVSGIDEGMRDNGLFNYMVFFNKKYPDTWAEKTREINEQVMRPPMDARDVEKSINGFAKKLYEAYACKNQPICDVCDQKLCVKRKYGVAGDISDLGVEIGGMVIVMGEPSSYNVEVDGTVIEFNHKQLMNQLNFQEVIFDRLYKYTTFIKQDAWQDLVQGWLTAARKVPVPAVAKTEGQLASQLKQFCMRTSARDRTELIDGRTWHDPNGMTYFSSGEFILFLKQRGIYIDTNQAYIKLRKSIPQITFDTFKIKNVDVEVWIVPSFPEQDEDFPVPVKEGGEAM